MGHINKILWKKLLQTQITEELKLASIQVQDKSDSVIQESSVTLEIYVEYIEISNYKKYCNL